VQIFDCNNCQYRFKCFTSKYRPKVVTLNWKISFRCADCKHAYFNGIVTGSYSWDAGHVGLCRLRNMIVHKNSCACDIFYTDSKDISRHTAGRERSIKQAQKELKSVLNRKHTRTKLPKYCLNTEGIPRSLLEYLSSDDDL